MDVVVVESPAKAKTINKYLGSNYVVLASYGHVRDLPPKDGSVLPDRDFEIIYETGADSKKHLREIAKRHPDTTIGSYPYMNEKGFATRIVVRSRDAAKLATAKAEVEAMSQRIHAALAAKRNAS